MLPGGIKRKIKRMKAKSIKGKSTEEIQSALQQSMSRWFQTNISNRFYFHQTR